MKLEGESDRDSAASTIERTIEDEHANLTGLAADAELSDHLADTGRVGGRRETDEETHEAEEPSRHPFATVGPLDASSVTNRGWGKRGRRTFIGFSGSLGSNSTKMTSDSVIFVAELALASCECSR